MTTPKIERGIPLPPKQPNGNKGPYWRDVIAKMRVGDSFLIQGRTHNQVTGNFERLAKRVNATVALRTVAGGVRVWRTA